jgi:hypothetical protein
VSHRPTASDRPNREIDDELRVELHDELMSTLKSLPAATSGAGFHAAVLARAAAAATRRKLRRRRTLSLAAALIVVVAGVGAWSLEVARDRAARRAALVEEHRRLRGELDELRALAEGRSLLRLGGDASTIIVLDLATVPSGAATAPAAGTAASTLLHRSPG